MMRGFVPPDPETKVSQESFAVVYSPRRNRKRFPAGNVQILASQDEAMDQCDTGNNRHPAVVLGPSKSSEGQFIYYLVAWLDEE